jgi:GNAT superfamily N-acetyltransferase
MESFVIKPCTVIDGPAIGRNNVNAFWTDKTWIQIWRGRTCEFVAEQAAKRGARNLLLDRAHRRHLKAVDSSTGDVVGYARWVLPHDDSPGGDDDPCNALWTGAQLPDVSREVREEADREGAAAVWEFTNSTMDDLDAPITAMKEYLVKKKRYIGTFPLSQPTTTIFDRIYCRWTSGYSCLGIELDYLCVPPAFRRRGIASTLIQRGLEEAEKLGLDMFVLSMKAGVSVYRKAGFVLIDQVLIDASDLGGDKDYGGWFLEKCVVRNTESGE